MGTVRCHLEVSLVSTERDYRRRTIKAGATCRDTQVEPKAVKKKKNKGKTCKGFTSVGGKTIFELNQTSRDFIHYFGGRCAGINPSKLNHKIISVSLSQSPLLFSVSSSLPPHVQKCTHARMLAHPRSPGLITLNEKSSPQGHQFHPVSDEQKLHV